MGRRSFAEPRDTARTMSERNVEILRRAFEAFRRGDLDAAVADIAPECEYRPTGAFPDRTSVFRGPEGYKRNVAWLRDEFADAYLEIHELRAVGDRVLASVTLGGRGKRSGAEASWDLWQVWTFRDGKAVRGEGFTSRDEALEAAGLSE
jgi:ketosteroid isomerase-like protein